MKNKRKIGTFYENIAADYLAANGMMILERNYRTHFGEIDLIGLEGDGCVVFVEVKYRSTRHAGTAMDAVDFHKQWVLSKVAVSYLTSRYKSLDVKCRFDVVAIEGEKICWIQNAFDFQ